MRAHGNGLHSRGPSHGNISELHFDDSAGSQRALGHQPAGSAMQGSSLGTSQSPSRASEQTLLPTAARALELVG
jgi:hypothetical protein